MSSPPISSKADSDTESTAELPALRPAPPPGSGEHRQSSTDTWMVPSFAGTPAVEAPPAARAAEGRHGDGALQTLSTRLHETQGLLAGKDERLRQLELARDEALEARAAAERRAAQLDRELAQLQAEHAFQLDEHARAHGHFDEQLAQARALLSAAGVRADELQHRLAELESAARAQALIEDRARAVVAMGDLREERQRSAALLESLQSAESRRALLGELVTELQREGEGRERELARVARALVGRDGRARELEAEIAQGASRIARLEQQVASLAAAMAERDAQLRRSHEELRSLQEGAASLRTQLASSSDRVHDLQTVAAGHSSSDSRQLSELGRLQAERAELTKALESARTAALAAASHAKEREAAQAELSARNAELESALAAERRRVGQLEEEQADATREMQDWAGALQTTQHERYAQADRLSAAEARVRELEERAAEQQEALSALQNESGASSARARELEADLHAAEEAVHRLESEARGRNARLEELERANVRWRTLEEARLGVGGPASAPVPPPEAAAVAPEPLADGAMRLLIRSENGREVMHVLGHRTSIGRTPDNDLRIEAKYISRHHAVILVGPVHTVVEDLNSTNGVLVNGQRITRQTLKDGDTVQIARVQYRFVVRKGGEKR